LSRVILEKPVASQLVKRFHTFYRSQRFIAAFTSAKFNIMFAKSYHWFFKHTVLQFTLSHPYFLKMYISFIIITHYLPMTHSPLDTPTCTACASFSCVPRPQSSCSFLQPDIWQKVQIIKFFIMQFSPAFCYFFLHRNPAHTQNASVFAMTKIYVSSLLYREMICNWNGLLWLTFELPWTYPKSTLRLKPVLPVIYTASRKSNMQQNSSHWNDGVEMSHLILVSAFY